jgi:Uma2 family endonuclease
MATTGLMTAEDLWNLEDDGCRHELLQGELVSMAPTGDAHGRIQITLSWYLKEYVRAHPEISAWGGDTGFIIDRAPDTILAPDLALIRTTVQRQRGGFLPVIPELVIEILSPSDRAGIVNAKTAAYFRAGVQRVWLVDPERLTVTVYSGVSPPRVFQSGEVVVDAEFLPDFEVPVDEIFE